MYTPKNTNSISKYKASFAIDLFPIELDKLFAEINFQTKPRLATIKSVIYKKLTTVP